MSTPSNPFKPPQPTSANPAPESNRSPVAPNQAGPVVAGQQGPVAEPPVIDLDAQEAVVAEPDVEVSGDAPTHDGSPPLAESAQQVNDTATIGVASPAPRAGGTVPTPFPERFQLLVASIGRVVRGKPEVLQQAVICLLSGGHLLVEDVPGVGKTSLARALAHSVDMEWNRVQFTPDLLPSDVTGVSIFNQKTQEFEFRPGPVFANIVVGDEINRASPKTQSALLEVMEEGTVTADGATYQVPQPFMVVATQNPIDLDGTYQLPEAQIDRFLMKLSIGYPDPDAERDVITTHIDGSNADTIEPVMSVSELNEMISFTRRIEVSAAAKDYAVALAGSTRQVPEVRLGVSPRGSLALARAARVVAAAAGRPFVTAEDMKQLAPSVLAHRVLVSSEAELQGVTPVEIIARVIAAVPVPRSRAGA